MKMTRISAVLWLILVGVLKADPAAGVPAAEGVHAKVDALMKEERAKEAADLLEKALEDNPDDVEALRKLGGIYTIVLKQPEKGAPLLEKGVEMGDKKCLNALALAQIFLQDNNGMLAYKKQYVDNFESLSGSRVICFYIAGLEKDGGLFSDLLRRTPGEDIDRDKSLCTVIARTAKLLVENDQVGPPAAAPDVKPDNGEKPQPEREPDPR